MTIKEAAAQGIRRLRLPHWADPRDYLEIDLVNGQIGPWGHLYAPAQEVINEPTPQSFLLFPSGWDTRDTWEQYEGPLLPRQFRRGDGC